MTLLRRILVIILVICIALPLGAQRIQTFDTDGNPVGYVTVLGSEGNIIGMTDLDGILADVKGATSVTVTHVAFKTQTVNVASLQNGRIVMQDADYSLPEITIAQKDYIYVQTYYRVIYMWDDTLVYYRAGVTDNTYNIKKKTVKSDHEHFSMAESGAIKFALNSIAGKAISKRSDLPTSNLCLNSQSTRFTLTPETPGRQRVNYKDRHVGFLIDDAAAHERRLSLDRGLLRSIIATETGKKASKRDARRINRDESWCAVYRLDEDGNCRVEDFVMSQMHSDEDTYRTYLKKYVHTRMWVEVYTTDRAYVDKKELKERKRNNRVSMTFDALQQFETSHNIPALPVKMQQIIVEMASK